MERGPPGPPRVHRGWHDRGYLPHLDAAGLAQHVTFRLHGSLPASVIERLRAESEEPDDLGAVIETELARGLGPVWLTDPVCARMVVDALGKFDADRYGLLAWCVMPNHVHVLIRQMDGWPLGAVVKSWKGYTARMANRHLRRAGSFWSADYFDRYVRNPAQLTATIAYIENNPVKAGLCRDPQDWPWSSAFKERRPPSPHVPQFADLEVRAPSQEIF